MLAGANGGLVPVHDRRFDPPRDWPIRFEIEAADADLWMRYFYDQCARRGWSSGGIAQIEPSENSGSISVNTDSVFDSLNGAFMGALEANNGRWGVFTDLVYVDVSGSKSGTRDFQIGNSSAPSTTVAAIVANFRRRKAGITCAPPAATRAPTAASTNKSCCELRVPSTGIRTRLKTRAPTMEPAVFAA